MPPGWEIGNVSCANGSIVTSWRRGFGLLSWAESALQSSGLEFSGYTFDATGSSVSASLPLKPIETLMSAPDKRMVDLRNEINDLFQSLGLQVSLVDEVIKSQQPPTPSGKGPAAAKAAAPVSVKALKFSFNSEHNPLVWMDLLTKYSGLEVRLITYSPSTNAWHYEGAIYVL